MALTKINTNGVSDSAITSAKINDGTVTKDDLGSTLDLSSKTVTLPAASVTAHATNPTKTSIEALGIDLPAADLTGTINSARLGSGTAGSGNFLRGDGAWEAAGLPSGGSVGQVVVNTGSGTGSWAVLEDGSYPSNFVQQQGYSYKVTGYSSTTSSSQVDAVDFGTVGTVQKGSMVTVTMNLPSCYSNVDGYGGTYYLDIRDDADPTNYYLNHIYHARSISSTTHRPAGSLQGVLRMKVGSGTTTFSVKMTVTCDYSPYPAKWNAVSRNAASLIWTERN